MAEAAAQTEELRINRTFAAPRDRVFAAWTEPRHLSRWFAPNDQFELNVDVDLRAGGSYRIEMNHQDGNRHVAFGEYQEITKPERLVFTWSWESGIATGTLVTVEFIDKGAETEVQLTHEKLPSTDVRGEHGKGWNGCLGRLETYLAA